MEEYKKYSDQLTCNQSKIISKFTSNIKNTSKSTSKTNQIRFMGAMGGLTPLTSLSQAVFPPQRGAEAQQQHNAARNNRGQGVRNPLGARLLARLASLLARLLAMLSAIG